VSRKRDKKISASVQTPATGQNVQPAQIDWQAQVVVSFKYSNPGGRYCLSDCNAQQVREFKECLKKLTEYTYQQLFATSNKDPKLKQGLAWEMVNESGMKVGRPAQLDPSMRISSVRATQRMRLFLTQKGNVFYILWYDKDHEIAP